MKAFNRLFPMWTAIALLVGPVSFAQDASTRGQEWCAKRAEANIAATKRESPQTAKTIMSFLYEYSPKHHTCVAVMEYKTSERDGAYAQILARNMVTNQPMRGYAEVYLIPLRDKQRRIDAINALFDEYSK